MERIFNNVKITSSFEKSETRENLVSGETIGQHFGKIAKVIDDLENGEFNCNLTIDNALSETSENPVQNKVINAALKSKANQTTVDNALAQKANLEYVNASLTGKSDTGHTHDDRYYTESEIDTKLNTKLNTSLKGAANGLAELDSSGKVPSAQLPSYVDDVLEYTNKTSFPATGESGKIYISQDNNKTYRWSGSAYVEISPSLALGETSATAYRGDRGKIAYDHSQTTHAPSNAQANVIETVKVNGTALTPSSKAVDITVPSYSAMTGATSSAAGTSGLVPAPSKGDKIKFLRGDGTWVTPEKLASSSYTTVTIDTSDWTDNPDGGYMYTYNLPNPISNINYIFDVELSTDQSAAKLQLEAWNCIIADGNISRTFFANSVGVFTTAFTFYAFTTQPSVALTVGIQGVS